MEGANAVNPDLAEGIIEKSGVVPAGAGRCGEAPVNPVRRGVDRAPSEVIGSSEEGKHLKSLLPVRGFLVQPNSHPVPLISFLSNQDSVGVRVTLRSAKMYEFLDRFISVASPRIRDFRGLSAKGFDGRGNYNFGVNEQIIFPEIDYDKVNNIRGMNISIVTTGKTDEEAYELLIAMGFPIHQKKKKIEEGAEE